MMYARWSLNYLVSIGLIRRAALLAALPLASAGILKSRPGVGMLAAHLGNAERDRAASLPAPRRVHPSQHRRAR